MHPAFARVKKTGLSLDIIEGIRTRDFWRLSTLQGLNPLTPSRHRCLLRLDIIDGIRTRDFWRLLTLQGLNPLNPSRHRVRCEPAFARPTILASTLDSAGERPPSSVKALTQMRYNGTYMDRLGSDAAMLFSAKEMA
uniref:Uncharacterized protein n=1 Tax=Timema bartmani TaxID=61472 RepID=A0A7R9I7Z9_9NEOP|nr:unnamed protein product [Timema bartmani]